jgi:hypothetical protein
MGVYELSGAGGLILGRTEYKSMNAGNMYGAMVPIAQAVGTGSANELAFYNIPQGYQDLFVSIYANLTATGTVWAYANGYSASGLYSDTLLYGTGTSALSSRSTAQNQFSIIPAASVGSTYPVSINFHLLNYANTTTFKTALTRGAIDQNGSGQTTLDVALWRSTAAVTSLGFNTFGAANYTTSTTATLYGIRAVSS